MPQRAKSHLSAPKKRRAAHLSDAAAPDRRRSGGLPAQADPALDEGEPHAHDINSRRFAEDRLELYAMLGWSHCYARLFQLEAQANGAHEAVGEYMSTYRERQLRAGGAAAARVLDDSAVRISHDFERMARERCMHYIPFSQAVKAVSMLVDQAI